MNELKDIEYIIKHNIPICMDVCHLCMGDSLSSFSALSVVEELTPYIQHFHIADAQGIDGEGLHFGQGDAKNLAAIRRSLDINCISFYCS
jgi:N-acetylneuraminate synthase